MSITHAPPTHVRQPHISLLLIAIVGLVAAVIGVGTWVLVDRSGSGGSEATRLIDESNVAMSRHDAAAITSLYARDAVLARDDGVQTVGANGISALLPVTAAIKFQIWRVAPVTVEGEFATTFLRYTSTIGHGTEVTVIQFREGRILRQWLFKLGVTPPFDGAVVP